MSGPTLARLASEAAKKRLRLRDITDPAYADMKYPKLVPIMRFTTRQYEIEGFGGLFTMDTVGMGGALKLSTVAFTPSAGTSVPFLLIDAMEKSGKSLCYVEYYDCTAAGAAVAKSENQREEFSDIPDYNEKPAWYIERRTPYSLIKGGKGVSPERLVPMALTCLERYFDSIETAPVDEANLTGLLAFRRDMLEKGNPSSATMERVLGKDGAEAMFKRAIMPVDR